MNIPYPIGNLFLFGLSRHPLQGEVQLDTSSVTKYERKTVTRVDCLVPIHCVADPELIAYIILTSPHSIYISS
jgi:hypothetical protein